MNAFERIPFKSNFLVMSPSLLHTEAIRSSLSFLVLHVAIITYMLLWQGLLQYVQFLSRYYHLYEALHICAHLSVRFEFTTMSAIFMKHTGQSCLISL